MGVNMLIEFDLKKIIQIVNYIVKLNGNRINYTKLIKLLYIADREFLKSYNSTITGDTYYSMKDGPVLSGLYALIKGNYEKSVQKNWDSQFDIVDNYDIVSKTSSIEDGELCEAETDILKKMDDKFKDKTYSEMIDITHDENLFPEVEWKQAEKMGSSIFLNIRTILEKLGRTKAQIEIILDEAELYKQERRILRQE
jgi:uncharacterized phage-associated protein